MKIIKTILALFMVLSFFIVDNNPILAEDTYTEDESEYETTYYATLPNEDENGNPIYESDLVAEAVKNKRMMFKATRGQATGSPNTTGDAIVAGTTVIGDSKVEQLNTKKVYVPTFNWSAGVIQSGNSMFTGWGIMQIIQ